MQKQNNKENKMNFPLMTGGMQMMTQLRRGWRVRN